MIIVVLTLALVLYAEMKYGTDGTKSKLATFLYYLIAILLIVSIIMGIGDIVYSFHVTSQVYGQLFDEFQLGQGQVNCSSYVRFSLYTLGAIAFNYIFVEIGLVVHLYLWFIFDFRNGESTGHC